MSFSTELTDIEKRFSDAWAETTPIAFNNVAFDPTGIDEWVRLSIVPGLVDEKAIGTPNSRFYRGVGVIIISVFAPNNQGEARVRALAEQAASIFRSVRFNNIVCRTPYILTIGGSGNYYQVNVNAPYHRDEVQP